jgi:hypothetical protein
MKRRKQMEEMHQSVESNFDRRSNVRTVSAGGEENRTRMREKA